MTDTPASPSPESQSQLIAALAIIGALGVIAIIAMIAGWFLNAFKDALEVVGTIVGALSTALNAPTGISRLIAAAKGGSSPQP